MSDWNVVNRPHEDAIIGWCRSKPRGYGHPVMREGVPQLRPELPQCRVVDLGAWRGEAVIAGGETWMQVHERMVTRGLLRELEEE